MPRRGARRGRRACNEWVLGGWGGGGVAGSLPPPSPRALLSLLYLWVSGYVSPSVFFFFVDLWCGGACGVCIAVRTVQLGPSLGPVSFSLPDAIAVAPATGGGVSAPPSTSTFLCKMAKTRARAGCKGVAMWGTRTSCAGARGVRGGRGRGRGSTDGGEGGGGTTAASKRSRPDRGGVRSPNLLPV